MINRITLLLFIGLAWGQVEQDKLVLKDGTKYLGEFSTIDGKNVLFKPEGAFGFQPISINKIKEPIHWSINTNHIRKPKIRNLS